MGFSDGADKIFSGGIDNDIKVWDLRKNEVAMKLQGHTETITSMQLSPDGSYLLTNSMDCTLRIWDMRPYAPQVHCPFSLPAAFRSLVTALPHHRDIRYCLLLP